MLFNVTAFAEIPIATDNRIKTYVYNQNDIYLVLMESGFQTSIEFANGEQIQTLSLGNSYAWSITPVSNRLFIKPLENNIRTNMTVITNYRTYQFDLVSKDENDSDIDIAYVVRFYYPKKDA
jgi:type IV secretion system protein VirB9